MVNQIAYFGAGCFWGVEFEFSKIKGVKSTNVGYMGGNYNDNPSYEDVCTGKTGHAEVVRVKFDSLIVSYEKLLEVFWRIHDPTELNRQGADVGTQYRSVIFYINEEQKNAALKSKNKMQNKLEKKIVTEIVKTGKFYLAEDYHQKYLEKKGKKVC
jgi:peptide-methionine (S)-S-oxide reductase